MIYLLGRMRVIDMRSSTVVIHTALTGIVWISTVPIQIVPITTVPIIKRRDNDMHGIVACADNTRYGLR